MPDPQICFYTQICHYRRLRFLPLCLSRQLSVVRLVQVVLDCHFGVSFPGSRMSRIQ